MTNIATVNKEKIEAVKDLTAPQLKTLFLNLWKKYYNALILKSDIKEAEKNLENITFIKENANEMEFKKIKGIETISEIHNIPVLIGVDLKENIKELSRNSTITIIYDFYLHLKTFNNLFSIIKDLLDNLNNNQCFNLASEISTCDLMIKKVMDDTYFESVTKNTELNIYTHYLKEKETFYNFLNNVELPLTVTEYMIMFEQKVNEKLKKTNIKSI